MGAITARGLRRLFRTPVKQPGVAGALKGLFSRKYNEIEAVKGIDLEIAEGELVGFLGPNGAGKTTTLKMLSGILLPSGGEVQVLGFTPFRREADLLRQMSIVMGNKNQLWWDLPAHDSFVVLRELYDVPERVAKERLDFLLETLQMTSKVHTQVRKLSLGERMKCELIAALLHQPRVVFLDEPTIGLDLISQKRIRDFLRELNAKEGSTMILTSHYMQDVQELCERVIIIDHGAKIYDGSIQGLMQQHASERRLRLTLTRSVEKEDMARFGSVVEQDESSIVLAVPRDDVAQTTAAVLAQLPVVDIAIEEVSLDEVIRELFARG